jgi:hypothetical protein
MNSPKPVRRAWLLRPARGIRIRCSFARRGKRVLTYVVQLEIRRLKKWTPVLRYDNAHGFCHKDILHPDGTQEKVRLAEDPNANFTQAIKDLRANWKRHISRFLKEEKK